MGASYWARWMCVGHVANLSNLLLPHVLAEGYELLTYDGDRQVFDRGGVMKKISWSLNGGRWSDAPVDLSISYSYAQGKTTADFRWRLAVRPVPTTHKEQASFEAWIRGQLDRIIANLNEQADASWADGQELVGVWDDSTHGHPHTHQTIGEDTNDGRLALMPQTARRRTSVQYASTYVEQAPQCDRCWKPAVAIPGTTGRYYCLICHRHLPRRAAVHQH
jgi:hypothetical protein